MEYGKIKELKQNNYKKFDIFALIIFVFAAILISAISLLGLLVNDFLFLILLIPVFILPSLFSFNYLLLHRGEYDKLSFGVFFAGIKAYFSSHYNGSFAFTSTLLRGILYYILATIISILCINLPMYQANACNYKTVIDGLVSIMDSKIDSELIIQYINDNAYTFDLLSITLISLPFFVILGFMCYSLSKNTLSIIVRDNLTNYQGRFISLITSNFFKSKKKEFFLADLYLNWPSYLGFVFFFCLGGYIGSLYKLHSVTMFTFSLAFSLFGYIGIFGSFRYQNTLVLYEYFKDDIKNSDLSIQNQLIKEFADLLAHQKRTSEQKNNKNEENKKDSNES